MNEQIHTPRTDDEFDRLRFQVEPMEFGSTSQRDVALFGMRDFSKLLEREIVELKQKCAMEVYMHTCINHTSQERQAVKNECCVCLTKERDQLKQEVERLKNNEYNMALARSIVLSGSRLIERNRAIACAKELATCLTKYQGRYHKAPHAQKDWEKSKAALASYDTFMKEIEG